MPNITAQALAAHIAKYPPTEDGTLFSTRLGSPYRHDYFGSQIFKQAVKKAGLPDSITTHDLRHHFASELVHAGESVVVVSERLGHNNATTVLKVYGHLVANQDDRTRLWDQKGTDLRVVEH